MKKLMTKCVVWCLFLAVLIGASGCAIFGGSVQNDIRDVVDSYFEDVISGQFVEDDFSSVYAKDNPFASMDIENEMIWFYIEKGLTRISYEIEDVRGKKNDGTGECTVVIQVVDVEAVFEDVEEEGYSDEAFLEAISERRAPTTEIEVVFDMEYNSRRDTWIISDSSDFAEEFVQPYLDLPFPSSQGPSKAFADFVDALMSGDKVTLNEIYPGFWESLYVWEELEEVLYLALFAQMEFELLDSVVEDNVATLTYHFSYPDLSFIETAFSDEQVTETAMREMHIALYNGDNYTEDDFIVYYADLIINMLEEKEFEYLSKSSTVAMILDDDTEEWTIISFDDLEDFVNQYLNLPVDEILYQLDFDAIELRVARDLIEEGLVDEDYFAFLFGGVEVDGSDATAEDLYFDIIDVYWFDPDGQYVDYYVAGQASIIEYAIEFQTRWTNVDLIISYYYDDGDEIYELFDFEFSLYGDSGYSFWYGYQDGLTQLPAGTYYIAIELANGEFLFSDYVDVR